MQPQALPQANAHDPATGPSGFPTASWQLFSFSLPSSDITDRGANTNMRLNASDRPPRQKALHSCLISVGLQASYARLFLSGGDQRHEHRADREGVHLRFAGELPQIASSAGDRISTLENRRDHDRSGFLAQDGLGLLPSARTDTESRSYDARGGKEVSPVRYPALGIVDDVGTGVENHAQGKGNFPCPLELGMK